VADTAAPFLTPWSSFYVMTGSSAAALVGLMFVVIALVSGMERRSSTDGVSTFSTPTVMHFAAVLLVSAILVAPWRLLVHPAALLGLAGLYGLVYLGYVTYRTAGLTAYSPDLEDWVWFTILPLVAYGTLLAGAIMLPTLPEPALFTLAGGVALLIVIGIRNAWDVVTYIAIGSRDEPPKKPD
jgi:hypothetical protein